MNNPKHQQNLTFYKMHSLGNHFMVLDLISQACELSTEQIAQWGNPHTGIGFDQLLTIEPPTDPDMDFNYGIYNADGSRAEQCGNGTRAVTLLAHKLGLTHKNTLRWQSPAGQIQTHFEDANSIETIMTTPELDLEQIPFAADHGHLLEHASGFRQFALAGADDTFTVTPISMGNPHGVIIVDDLFSMDVDSIGKSLTAHPAFPAKANISFCQIVDPQFIRLRVFERGVGETQACGSGACAAVVAMRSLELVEERVKVSLPGGKLRIKWSAAGTPVTMIGSAAFVYQGQLGSQL